MLKGKATHSHQKGVKKVTIKDIHRQIISMEQDLARLDKVKKWTEAQEAEVQGLFDSLRELLKAERDYYNMRRRIRIAW